MSLRRALELRQGGTTMSEDTAMQHVTLLQCNMLKELQLVKTQHYMLHVTNVATVEETMLHVTWNK